MQLTIEQNGETFNMEVLETKVEMPTGVTGIRFLNRISLNSRAFYDFILAISIDDFEAVREIFKSVLDKMTRELPYCTGIDHLSLGRDRQTQNEVNNIIAF